MCLTAKVYVLYFMISFHLNDMKLQPYQVLDTEVNPAQCTHCHVTIRLCTSRLNGHCWNRKVEGATSVLSEESVTCAEPPSPPPQAVVMTHVRSMSDTNPVT
jgi:hypothetical protein